MPRQNSEQWTVDSQQSDATLAPAAIAGVRNSQFAIRFRPGTLVLVLIALALFAWYAFANWMPKPPGKPDATWVRILDEGIFRVGIDPSFPPFESDDGRGNLRGLDIALAEELARVWSSENVTTTIRVEYVYTGYDGLYDALKAAQYDAIISALPYDPLRTEDISFSHSYFDGGPVIVVRENDATTKTYNDLAGKRIGVELGSTGDSFARRWQRRLKFDLRTFDMPADALQSLHAGQVDAVFTDMISFNDFAQARKASGLKAVGAPLVNEWMVVGVRKNTPTLLAQINAVIDAMKRDGRLEKMQKEWLVESGQ